MQGSLVVCRLTSEFILLPLQFFQVESFSGEVFQVDTEDMKKKLRSSGEVFQVGGGESFQVFGRIYAPAFFKTAMFSI